MGDREPAIEEYYEMYLEAEECSNKISESIIQSSSQQFLKPGRVIVVKSQSVSSYFWFVYSYDLIFDIYFSGFVFKLSLKCVWCWGAVSCALLCTMQN